MYKVIGITGPKYAGKDTTGKYLSELIGYPLHSFAKPLKDFCRFYFNLNEEELNGSLKEKTKAINVVFWDDLLVNTLNSCFPEFITTKNKEYLCSHFYRQVFLPYLFGENDSIKSIKLVASPREIMQRVGTNFFRNIQDNFWLKQADKALGNENSLILTDVRFENEAEWILNKKGLIINIINDNLNNVDPHISESGIGKKYITLNLENNGTIEELKNGIEFIVEYKIKGNNLLSVKDLF